MNQILITGAARSGTSLTAGIIDLCGAFGGELRRANVNNKKGMFENKRIVDQLVKPYFRQIGVDPMGQDPLPYIYSLALWPDLEKDLLRILRQQGWNGKSTWYYKGAKMCLIWPIFDVAFPDAKWVIVRRSREEIINSCLRTSFMRAFQGRRGWGKWVDTHIERFDEMKAIELYVKEVWPSKMIEGDLNEIKGVIEWLGLEWKEDQVKKFIEPQLWNRKRK